MTVRWFIACAAVFTGFLPVTRSHGQECLAHWSEEFWASAPPGSEVRAARVVDLGAGPALYIATIDQLNNDGWIGRWDGTRLFLIGRFSGSLEGATTEGVYALG